MKNLLNMIEDKKIVPFEVLDSWDKKNDNYE